MKPLTIETKNSGVMTLNTDRKAWTISVTKCGMVFNNVAIIHEPMSPNPIWEFPKPLGQNGVTECINLLTLAKSR